MLIKEKVKPLQPFRVDNGNIHGHVCIDLHNTKSGFTERIEGDNLVTNAVQDILNLAAIGRVTPPYNLFPIATKLLGGLFIFDGTLTENVNNVNFPGSEAHLVGCAGDRVDTSLNYLGVRNNEESKYIQDGYTTVWDFSTNQANGTIKSIARTSAECGNWLIPDVSLYSFQYSNRPNNDKLHLIFHNGYSIWENLIHYSPLDGERLYYVHESTGRNFDTSFFQSFGSNCYFSDNVNSLIFTNKDNAFISYNIDTQEEKILTEDVGVNSYPQVARIKDNFYYKTYSISPIVHKLNLISGEDKTISTKPLFSYSKGFNKIGDAILFNMSDSSITSIIYYDDDTTFLIQTNSLCRSTANYFLDKPFWVIYDWNNYGNIRIFTFKLNTFLGTIFNLPAPITKTANQTMKITYTLTNV